MLEVGHNLAQLVNAIFIEFSSIFFLLNSPTSNMHVILKALLSIKRFVKDYLSKKLEKHIY